MAPTTTKLAIISGASTGIGYYLAQNAPKKDTTSSRAAKRNISVCLTQTWVLLKCRKA